jgi:CheY-like chemotaxis protein
MKVKEEIPALPVILMTAYNYDKDHILKRARLQGLEGALFKKPVNPKKLRSVLMDIHHKAQVAKAAAYHAKHSARA